MKVLLFETDPCASDGAARELEEAGHEVVRCHHRALPAFPCVALQDGGRCPIDGGDIDVALTVRAHPLPCPATLEDGVVCALRHHVPLVVAGNAVFNPFEPWMTAAVGDQDLVEVCERVVAARPNTDDMPSTHDGRRHDQH
jgi:hypothetical protein